MISQKNSTVIEEVFPHLYNQVTSILISSSVRSESL